MGMRPLSMGLAAGGHLEAVGGMVPAERLSELPLERLDVGAVGASGNP